LHKLLARHAEEIFWMSRQVERMNNIARILDVQESFGHQKDGTHNWLSVLKIYADDERFLAQDLKPTAENVLYFYILDGDNPTSIYANLKMARQNARALRPQISTEMWFHLNTFYNSMRGMKRRDISEERLNLVCARIKEACQTFSGITAETLYKDDSWYFSKIGMNLERADQTSRLLDAKYEALQMGDADMGSASDMSQWNALLRSAAGFHAYRRVHSKGFSAESAAGFLLFDERFPRSVSASISEACLALNDLHESFGSDQKRIALDAMKAFQSHVRQSAIKDVIASGMHDYLDDLQKHLIDITSLLEEEFFAP
jgi:uncharacterized alpha-E superfamily protein